MSNVEQPDSDRDHLYPPFNALLHLCLAEAQSEMVGKYSGLHAIAMYEGYRSAARQEWLYAQGRTRPGDVVTNDRVPRRHGYGMAADCVGYTADGKPSWNWPNNFWLELGHCARAHGLFWGGNWALLPDRPHIQMPDATVRIWKPKAIKYLRSLGLTTPSI